MISAIAHSLAIDYLTSAGAENIRVLKEEYPYALYDIQYTENGARKYAIVKQTATKSKYFSLVFPTGSKFSFNALNSIL